jgi:hypothetical protein
MKRLVLLATVILIGMHTRLFAGELRMILAPRSTTLTAEGYVTFDVYLHNDSRGRVSAPAPEAEFTAFWTLRDVDNVRPERQESNVVFGTDTVKKYPMEPKTAIRCEISNRFLAEPGDILVLYITVEIG